jgi:hypothetical protein
VVDLALTITYILSLPAQAKMQGLIALKNGKSVTLELMISEFRSESNILY